MADKPNLPQFTGDVQSWATGMVAELDKFTNGVARESRQPPNLPGFHSTQLPDAAKYASNAIRNEHSTLIYVFDTQEVLYSDGTQWVSLGGGTGPIGRVMVYKTGDVSANSGSWSVLSWDAETFDTMASWDISDPTKIYVPAGVSYARMYAACAFDSNATGYRAIWGQWSFGTTPGQALQRAVPINGAASHMEVFSSILPVSEGDYVQIAAYQNSGGALNLLAGAADENIWALVEWYA